MEIAIVITTDTPVEPETTYILYINQTIVPLLLQSASLLGQSLSPHRCSCVQPVFNQPLTILPALHEVV